MKLWKRASGALKDHRSLLKASLTSRSGLRNPDIEIAVIKGTTHDESCVDYRSAQRVFAWVRISDDSLYHVLWVLFRRMKRTRNWVVILKGLMLLHGVFCCKVPGIQEIGQLPFDLINLKDKHTKHRKIFGLNKFICDYYDFLDQKSSFIFLHSQEQIKRREFLSQDEMNEDQKEKFMIQDFIWLQKLQDLLDTLLEIQPKSSQTVNVLVLEAMDCIVIEIYDIYSHISKGIETILARIYFVGINEAKMALSILQKAKVQHEEIMGFLEFCRDTGVGNVSHCPKMEQIPQESIRGLEDIINGESKPSKIKQSPKEEVKSIIVVENHKLTKTNGDNKSASSLKTATSNGDRDVFKEEERKSNLIDLDPLLVNNNPRFDPFVQQKFVEVPDLISL